MSKKTICITVDDETEEILKRLGKEILLTDNKSHIIRYAVKFASSRLLEKR